MGGGGAKEAGGITTTPNPCYQNSPALPNPVVAVSWLEEWLVSSALLSSGGEGIDFLEPVHYHQWNVLVN